MFASERFQPERLRKFKRVVSDLDFLENVAIAALKKAQKEDHCLNGLLERVCHEIGYPGVILVATTLSQAYFHIYPDLRLLCVPLVEGQFLLHLPDLYHELAHPLLVDPYTIPEFSATMHPADDARMSVMLYGLELIGQRPVGRRSMRVY